MKTIFAYTASYTIRQVRALMCLILLLSAFSLYGQHRNVRFQHLTIEDGLAQNMVDCMLQDSQGFMWFGTWNGLCRYDGYNFQVYSTEGLGSGNLGNNFIYALYEDGFGNIWVGTRRGLYTYQYNSDRFVEAQIPVEIDGFDQLAVNAIAGVGNKLLIGTEEGIYAFGIANESGDLSTLDVGLSAELSGENAYQIREIIYSDQQEFWVGTNQGVYILNDSLTSSKRLIAETSLSSQNVQTIYQSSDGDFWLGTEFGLNHYEPQTGKITTYYSESNNSKSLIHNSIMDIIEDGSGRLHVATLGGLSIKEKGVDGFKNHESEYFSEHSLTNNFINSLLKDDHGNIWIGTERGGINYYNINQNIFEHFESRVDDPNSLSHPTVNSIYEDDKYLWIGTAGGGLDRYNKHSEQFENFNHDSSDPRSLSNNFVTKIFRDSNGQLWVSTWGSGLNKLVNEGARNEYFERVAIANEQGLISNFVSSMQEDDLGRLWVGTLSGLVRYNPETGNFLKIEGETSERQITEVGSILFDSEGQLWVGTRIGLYQLDINESGEVSEITRFTHDPSDSKSISGNYVISLLEDTSGDMWFGTYGQGVNRLRKGESKFTSYTMKNGLSNNVVYGMLQDEFNNIWMSTDYGLSRMNPNTGQLRNFYVSDGLLNNQYYWSAAYKNAQGKLYFGGMEGMDSFNPEWIKEVTFSPDVVITDLKLFNESITPQTGSNGVEIINNNPAKVSEVNLSYKEKNFGIEFSSLNYQEPDMIRYAYKLEGFDEDWNYVTSDRRYASYTNLKPGDYTFMVKAAGSNGEFSAKAKTIKVIIEPPFWQTAWFRVLAAILLIGLVVGYIRLRTYNLKKQKQTLEKQVAERTDEINQQKEELALQAVQLQDSNLELEEQQRLIAGQNQRLELQNKEIKSQHDKLVDLNKKLKLVSRLRLSFFTNISHEFRTPLTLILGPLEKLMKEKQLDKEVHNSLNIMNRNAQRLLHLINQIMDFRKIEKGRMELKVARGNLSQLCKDVFEAFQSLADIKNISFTYAEQNVPEEVWFEQVKVENILYNLLSNAFKYTPENGKITLEVAGLRMSESKLSAGYSDVDSQSVISIKIKDSGFGISQENLPLVFKRFYRIESEEAFQINGSGIGLALTEELIKTHHGEIFVDSKVGEGSVFEVQFPCLKTAYHADEVTQTSGVNAGIKQQISNLKEEMVSVAERTHETDFNFVYKKDRSTVLVVEDNSDLRKFITHRLNETYNILEAENGEIGIELAKKESPDLIISDVMMPKVDGMELCTFIKSNLSTCHIPVVLLTAKSSVEHKIQGLELGADEYLPKPFNFELLEARVQNLIDSRNNLKHQFILSKEFDASKATANKKDEAFLTKAIAVVEERIDDPDFGVKEFITEMHVSRSFMHKKLTALTNQSTAEFINAIRLKKALELLIESNMNVSEVAYAVGYNDPKYFTRIFTRYYGESPKKYLLKIVSAS